MKLILFSLVLTLGAFAHADLISVSGTLPANAKVAITVGYQAKSTSLFCTHYSFEDNTRLPDNYNLPYAAASNGTTFAVTAPVAISKCDAELIALPYMEVTLSGTTSLSDLHLFGGQVSFQQSQNNVTEVQKVECEKTQVATNVTTTTCTGTVLMGPDMKVNLEITAK